MKIAFVIPFKYKWNSYSTVRSALEMLPTENVEPIMFIKKFDKSIDIDQIWLMGSGTKLTKEEYNYYKKSHIPVIAFGLSDPNLYNEEHFENCDIYCTNSLQLYMELKNKKPSYWYPACCDKRYHKNFNLEKTTNVLFIGTGNHKFLPFRNEIINDLRAKGIKIKIFGKGWNKHEDSYKFIDGIRLIEEINKAKMLLDLNLKTTSLSHKIFEGSACGTPVVTPYRGDSGRLFDPFKEVISYKKFSELEVIIKYYLNNLEELKEIGIKAQKRCYKEHNIRHRIHWLVKFIRKNI